MSTTPPDTLMIDGHVYKRQTEKINPDRPMNGSLWEDKTDGELFMVFQHPNGNEKHFVLCCVSGDPRIYSQNGWGFGRDNFKPSNKILITLESTHGPL